MENKNNKYKVDFSLGCANEILKNKDGKEKINRFKIFTDCKGLKIFTRKGVVYLSPENSEVM